MDSIRADLNTQNQSNQESHLTPSGAMILHGDQQNLVNCHSQEHSRHIQNQQEVTEDNVKTETMSFDHDCTRNIEQDLQEETTSNTGIKSFVKDIDKCEFKEKVLNTNTDQNKASFWKKEMCRKQKADHLESVLHVGKKIKQETEDEVGESSINIVEENQIDTQEKKKESEKEQYKLSYAKRNADETNKRITDIDKQQQPHNSEDTAIVRSDIAGNAFSNAIESEMCGFDREEMQSQRCVIAFNTYGNNGSGVSAICGDKVLDVNIERINQDKQKFVCDTCNERDAIQSSTEHVISLENVQDGCEMNFSKTGIKIEDAIEIEDTIKIEGNLDTNEILVSMEKEKNSSISTLGTEPTETNSMTSEEKCPLAQAAVALQLQEHTVTSAESIEGSQKEQSTDNSEPGNGNLLSLYFNNELIYTCEECEFETGTKLNLICHYNDNHHDDYALNEKNSKVVNSVWMKWFQCTLCMFKATCKKNLTLHYKFRHDYGGELYECSHPVCSYVAQLIEDLLQHYRRCHVKRAIFIRRMNQ